MKQREGSVLLVVFLILLCVQSVHASSVVRTFDPLTVSPGSDVAVSITISLTQNESSIYIDELYPDGWTLVDAGDGIATSPGVLSWAYARGATEDPLTQQGPHIYHLRAPQQVGTYAFFGTYTLAAEDGSSDETDREIGGTALVPLVAGSVPTNDSVTPSGVVNPSSNPSCQEAWVCTEEWSMCVDSSQERVCTDLNQCGTTLTKPATVTRPCNTSVQARFSASFGDLALIIFLALAIPLLLILLIVFLIRSKHAKPRAAVEEQPTSTPVVETPETKPVETTPMVLPRPAFESTPVAHDDMKTIVQQYIAAGYPRATIESMLKERGWPQSEIDALFS